MESTEGSDDVLLFELSFTLICSAPPDMPNSELGLLLPFASCFSLDNVLSLIMTRLKFCFHDVYSSNSVLTLL